MQTSPTRMPRAHGLVAVLLLLCGCSNPKDEWTEQVALDGGELVVVSSSTESDVRIPIGDATQRFTSSATLKILNQVPEAPEWIDDRDPILLLRDPGTKEFVLVATSGDPKVWGRHGRPMNPYWMFRLKDGAWIEQPMADAAFGRDTNLVMTMQRAAEKGSLVTVEDKLQWNSEINLIRSYRRVEKRYQFGRD